MFELYWCSESFRNCFRNVIRILDVSITPFNRIGLLLINLFHRSTSQTDIWDSKFINFLRSLYFFLCFIHTNGLSLYSYLNLKILWSVWYEFDLIPLAARSWQPSSPNDYWILFGVKSGLLPDWIRYQIFLPIFLLQVSHTFSRLLVVMGTNQTYLFEC